MQSKLSKLVVILMIFILVPFIGSAKKKKDKKKEKPVYQFKVEKEVKRTVAKSQGRSGTCWCFATVSFLESEMLRMGKEEVDLSEMYVVRRTYPHRARIYVRRRGTSNHSQGGQAHDVTNQVRKYGMVPESVYNGMNIDEKRHNHGEMSTLLKGMVDGVLKRRGRKVTPRWMEAYEAVLDVYLGKIPESFEYKGKTYTPKSFVKDYMGLNMDDYVEFTSYSHFPYYKKCRLDIPDNWDYNGDYYNVPIDDLEKITDHAIKNGYSVVWDGDVSEKKFSAGRSATKRGSGYAILPEKDYADMTKAEKAKKMTAPVKEKVVTMADRDKTYANFTTTDDHLMHIVGLAADQTGTKFYLTKNSHGLDQNYKGHIYLSHSYFRMKTIALMVHKDALPSGIKEKLGIK